MKLKQFLTRPAKFVKRPKVDPRSVRLVEVVRDEVPPNIERSGDQDKIKEYSNDTQTFFFNVYSQSDPRKIYNCIICVMSDTVNLNSAVKFYCDCPSFKYEFAYLLWKNDSLYGDSFEDFLDGTLLRSFTLTTRFIKWYKRVTHTHRYNRPPKKNNIPYICKHLEACLVHVLRRT